LRDRLLEPDTIESFIREYLARVREEEGEATGRRSGLEQKVEG
jgi:hypothetical protein